MKQSRLARGAALLAGHGVVAHELWIGFRDGAPSMAALETGTLAVALAFNVMGLASAYQMLAHAEDEDDRKFRAAQRSAIYILAMIAVIAVSSTALGFQTVRYWLPFLHS